MSVTSIFVPDSNWRETKKRASLTRSRNLTPSSWKRRFNVRGWIYLTVWYGGWYNGLGKKHMMLVDRAKTIEHRVIVYCKGNPDKKVIQAIDVVIKAYRAEKGIKVDE